MRQQQVSVRDVGVGVEGDRGDVELPAIARRFRRLDVGELVGEREPLGVDAPLASAKNMKASSESGLCARVIVGSRGEF